MPKWFFFSSRRRHTIYWRDWSSDVCSSDLTGVDPAALSTQLLEVLPQPAPRTVTAELGPVAPEFSTADAEALGIREEISTFTTNYTSAAKIGRASCRERV